MSSNDFRRLFALLAIALLLAAFVRYYSLGSSILSGDESFSWRLTQYPTSEMVRRTSLDVHPPFYYILLQGWLDIWGTSALALRGFSALFGILGVGMIYLLCEEALSSNGRREGPSFGTARSASMFCAFLFAIHMTQVVPGRNARMYSLGVFLAGLSAWLLLRALRSARVPILWWTAYGFSVAAMCYTHYYEFFTIVALAVFCVGDILVRARATSWRKALPAAMGFFYAHALSLVCYLPWLPDFLFQLRTVRDDYWITALPPREVARIFFVWLAGMDSPGVLATGLGLGCFVLVCIWVGRKGGRAGAFFLLQALIPWILAETFSVVSGRPILLARCMAFSHMGLLAIWGIMWFQLPAWPERSALACLVGAACVFGLLTAWERVPEAPPAMQIAAKSLKTYYEQGDVVEVEGVVEVNRLRHYTAYAGLDKIDVRTAIDPSSRGLIQNNHEASIDSSEIITERKPPDSVNAKWWWAGEARAIAPPEGMRVTFQRTFEGGNASRFTLITFERIR